MQPAALRGGSHSTCTCICNNKRWRAGAHNKHGRPAARSARTHEIDHVYDALVVPSEESTFAPSRSPTPSTQERSTGRPRMSPVREYFVFNDETGKSACQVELESKNSVYGHEVTGKFQISNRTWSRKRFYVTWR